MATSIDNIAFGLKLKRTPKAEVQERVVETVLDAVGAASRA